FPYTTLFRSGVALGLGAIGAPRLEDGPVQRVTAAAVGEPVQPALGEVVARGRLDLDRHVLVVGLLALGRGEVVVPAGIGVGEDLGSGLGVGEYRLGYAALLRSSHETFFRRSSSFATGRGSLSGSERSSGSGLTAY